MASRQYNDRVVPFTTADGLVCNVTQVIGDRPPTRGPVLLVHGAGVRGNIFRAPTSVNFVDYLLDAGYDVWLENWRASIDLPRNPWTLDAAALYDHPRAVTTVVQETGATDIKAVIHCQGSTSFMMSVIAGLVPNVSTIVSNAVSLHTVVPPSSATKIRLSTPLMRPFFPYLDAQWGNNAPRLKEKLVGAVVRMTHRECDNEVCQYASFLYGTGHPTLWLHENLDATTHEWLKQEFGFCPITFYQQMNECVRHGSLVRWTETPDLPEDFAAYSPKTNARIAFFAGRENVCFLPESQVRSYNHFNAYRPGYHSLHLVDGYGHLDMFMGKNAVQDVFPHMLAAIQ